MRYVSTRGQCDPLAFGDTVMTGLAPDGGLFLPQAVPDVSAALADWRELPFRELFCAVVRPYVEEDLSAAVLAELADKAYAAFTHPEITPVVPVGDVFVCELFHGPTLAFKDVRCSSWGTSSSTCSRSARRA